MRKKCEIIITQKELICLSYVSKLCCSINWALFGLFLIVFFQVYFFCLNFNLLCLAFVVFVSLLLMYYGYYYNQSEILAEKMNEKQK